jgi:cholesterol oxidase
MTGCRHNAKNTLDKNYLYLAAQNGADVLPEHSVKYIRTIDGQSSGESGYEIGFRRSTAYLFSKTKKVSARGVVFAGGVLGTVRLLLDMKKGCLPRLSTEIGNNIRTNNESLVLIDSREYSKDFSRGIAIGAIFPPDENSHLEPVRYGSGSGFWKLLGVPLTHGRNMFTRICKLIVHLLIHPLSWFHIYFTKNHAKQSVILLFMQHINSTLRFKRGLWNLRSGISTGDAPTAFIPESKKLAEEVSRIIKGKPFVLVTEAVTGIPTTAHILGGAVIGKNIDEGVVDTDQKVFGYENMYVCDGSAISANPGVNPALTITAMTERAMSRIPAMKQ